jgi:type II secretory pathway pseudopilin PulG
MSVQLSFRGFIRRSQATTLIELIILIAILAILITSTTANFLEIETRVKLTLVRVEHQRLQGALFLHRIDTGSVPPTLPMSAVLELRPLTTPIAYLSTLPLDPFTARDTLGRMTSHQGYDYLRYRRWNHPLPIIIFEPWYQSNASNDWAFVSSGPDLRRNFLERSPGIFLFQLSQVEYDPTNGAISSGDIITESGLTPTMSHY